MRAPIVNSPKPVSPVSQIIIWLRLVVFSKKDSCNGFQTYKEAKYKSAVSPTFLHHPKRELLFACLVTSLRTTQWLKSFFFFSSGLDHDRQRIACRFEAKYAIIRP